MTIGLLRCTTSGEEHLLAMRMIRVECAPERGLILHLRVMRAAERWIRGHDATVQKVAELVNELELPACQPFAAAELFVPGRPQLTSITAVCRMTAIGVRPMHRMLLIAADESSLSRATSTLNIPSGWELTRCNDWRDACMALSNTAYEVALIVAEGDVETILPRLHYVRPGLSLLMLSDNGEEQLELAVEAEIVSWQQLETDGPRILQHAVEKSAISLAPPKDDDLVECDEVMSVIGESGRGENVHVVSFGHRRRLICHVGDMSREQAAALLAVGMGEKRNALDPVLVRFQHLPEVPGDWLTYTLNVGQGYWLQLVAWPHTLLHMLRSEADALALPLATLVGAPGVAPAKPLSLHEGPETRSGTQTFVLVWRSIERLPEVLQIPLRRTLVRIAQANSCLVNYLDVRADLIHMVVACPPGRKMIWAAHVFKSGSEAAIKEQFGVNATLWAKGYYARESSTRLSETELDLFLSRSRVSGAN